MGRKSHRKNKKSESELVTRIPMKIALNLDAIDKGEIENPNPLLGSVRAHGFRKNVDKSGDLIAHISVPSWEKWEKVIISKPFEFTIYEVLGESDCWLVLRLIFAYLDETLDIRLDSNIDSDIIEALCKADAIAFYSTNKSWCEDDVYSGKVKVQYVSIKGTGLNERVAFFYQRTSHLRIAGKMWMSPFPTLN